ncbi:hypothetical protein ACFLXA_05605 [Chloroflexota bacterium]
MMVTSFLEPKADVEIHTGEAYLLTGATVQVEVAVCPQEQLNPRELRLELVGTETYYVEMLQGKRSVQVKKAGEFTRVSYNIKDQPSFPPGVTTTRKFNIQVPIDAPPSSYGKEVNVCWTLKAILDLPKRVNLVKEITVQVMSIPIRTKKAMTDLPQEKSYKDCILGLEVPNTTVSKGAISGSLQVKALRKFQFRGIRVELRQIENVTGRVEVNNVVAQQDLSGPISLNVTDSPSFPFSLPLPANAPSTTVTPHSSLRWQLRAVLDRKMRRDIDVERDVIICAVAAEST